MKHVILGAGPAGVIAAEPIRKHAPKASITLIGGDCETTCAIDGNVSLRLDVKNTGEIGYTVQSSKTSALYYSNDWYKDGRVWKTMPQTLS
ncbi:MAG: hypothetical protein ACO26F_04065 [Burkholderiaceae bacterium]